MSRRKRSDPILTFFPKLLEDVPQRGAGSKELHLVQRTPGGPHNELEASGTDRNNPRHGLTTVEDDDRLPSPHCLEMLAKVGFEFSGAYGRHDRIMTLRGQDVKVSGLRRSDASSADWQLLIVSPP